MTLTIKKTRTRIERETTEVELTVPTQWGMFSDKGNKRISQIAQKAYDSIASLCAGGRPYPSAVRVVLLEFLMEWVKLWRTKTYGEASDTDVREQVGNFHDSLWYAAGMDGEAPWEEHYDEAQMRVRR